MTGDRTTGASRDRAGILGMTGASFSYDGRTVIESLDLELRPGAITVIIGANGSGKSTLLRGLARAIRPATGEVHLGGRDIRMLGAKAFARSVALLPQQPIAPHGITVEELVSRGRYPHQDWYRAPTSTDEAMTARALAVTATADLATRPVDELSGGQRQRVWIAMVLAQDTGVLLLDEPTTFLDIAHQIEVLDVLLDLNRARGTTIVMVLHDLNLAARYADDLIVLASGKIVGHGSPREIVNREMVLSAFGLDSLVVPDPISGSPMVVPVGRHHPAPTRDTSDI